MFEWVVSVIEGWGYPGVFLLMLAENLFPPIPSEVVMPLAGFAAAQGRMSLTGVILAGIAGSLAGNAVWFEVARRFGEDLDAPLTELTEAVPAPACGGTVGPPVLTPELEVLRCCTVTRVPEPKPSRPPSPSPGSTRCRRTTSAASCRGTSATSRTRASTSPSPTSLA